MKKVFIIAISCFFFTLSLQSQNEPLTSIVGTWIIDLTPSPDATPYLQEMTVTKVEGTNFSGSFYNTRFDNGKTNTVWDKDYFAFKTKDGSSVYFHSGYIEDGELKGLTYCEKRDFTMPWTGTRKDK